MLYHYTSFDALKSILRDSSSDEGIDFWATRFDCFGDKDEYKLGIETIKRLLPRFEERLQPDRRVAASFEWDLIIGNETLPFPYVVSFTDRNDNEYMWEHYACDGKGVVIELDDSHRIATEYTKHYVQKKCLYQGENSDDALYKEIENEYYSSAFSVLTGPQKDFAFALLSARPQLFVAMIGRYLLSYVATRIKGNRFLKEQETRLILASPRQDMLPIVDRFREVYKHLPIDIEGYESMMKSEKARKGANGDVVYYQDVYLPGSILKRVYVKDGGLVEQVNAVLRDKGFIGARVLVI